MFGMETNIFAGRKVLLSAATRGLGPALAKALISRGADVIGIDDCAHSLEALQISFGGTFVGHASASCEESAAAGRECDDVAGLRRRREQKTKEQ